MGTSNNAAHGALHSPLLLVLVTVALLAGSACSARELGARELWVTPVPTVQPLTVSITNSLATKVDVTVTTNILGLSPIITKVTILAGQLVPVVLPINVFLGTYTVSVAYGGQVYSFAPTLTQEILGDGVGLSLGLSLCINLPGLNFTVTVSNQPVTSTCVPPPNPSPPPPSPSPPPPTASPPPPAPAPSPPPPSPSPPPPSPPPPPPSPPPPPPSPPPPAPAPSPPPPSPSPPPPSPPPPPPSPPPPPPSPPPPAPAPSPPPPPTLSPATPPSPPPPAPVVTVVELNITNVLSVNITITVTTTAPNGVISVFTTVVIADGTVLLIVYPVGSKITSVIITVGANVGNLPSNLVAGLNAILSLNNVVQIQTSPCPNGVYVKADASVLGLASTALVACVGL